MARAPFQGGADAGLTWRQRVEQETAPVLRRPAVVPVTTVLDANVTLYTVPDDFHFYVHHAAVENNSAGNLAITLYLVPDGGTAGTGNRIYNGHVVAANTEERLESLMGHLLEPGDFLVADTDDATDGGNFWLWGELLFGGLPTL